MQNKLKSDTLEVMEVLKKAKLKNLMVTGDNPLTAITVARECGMVPSQYPAYLADTFTGTTHIWLVNLAKILMERRR